MPPGSPALLVLAYHEATKDNTMVVEGAEIMGWCSGTSIFDNVVGFVIDSDLPEQRKYDVLLNLATALENEDWDCQSASRYYDVPLVQKVMKELHPKWFEEDDE